MKKLDFLQGTLIVIIVVALLPGIAIGLAGVRLIIEFSPIEKIDVSDYVDVECYNLVWEKCESEVIASDSFKRNVHYKISGISTEEFVACVSTGTGLSPSVGPVLKRHINFDEELTFDFSSAKLFLYEANAVDRDWILYRETSEKQVLMDIPEVIAEEIMEYIQNAESNHLEYKDFEVDGGSANIKILRNDERDFLKLRFSFEEYDEIYWEAAIYACEGKYYLYIKNDALGQEDVWYVPCTLGLTAMINEVCEQYGLK